MKKWLFFLVLSICVTIGVFIDKKQKIYGIIEKYNYKHVQAKKPPLTVKLTNSLDGSKSHTLYSILSEKYNVKTSNKDYDLIIDNPYGNELITNQNAVKIFFTPEAALPDLNKYDLTIAFDHIDDQRYIRVPWYYFYPFNQKISTDYDRQADLGTCNPKKQYFTCFLVSNGCEGENWHNHKPFDGSKARIRIFHKLSLYKRVESGGKYLNNIGRVISGEETAQFLSQCKFVIAYENQSYDGYITEKPFQAYFAGAVPIYYSSPSAVQDINKKAIIYAGDFSTEDSLVEYIKKVDSDDDLYCNIWNQNIITDPSRNYKTVKSKLVEKINEVLDSKLKK